LLPLFAACVIGWRLIPFARWSNSCFSGPEAGAFVLSIIAYGALNIACFCYSVNASIQLLLTYGKRHQETLKWKHGRFLLKREEWFQSQRRKLEILESISVEKAVSIKDWSFLFRGCCHICGGLEFAVYYVPSWTYDWASNPVDDGGDQRFCKRCGESSFDVRAQFKGNVTASDSYYLNAEEATDLIARNIPVLARGETRLTYNLCRQGGAVLCGI
jgi:hypothetical protein